MKNKGFLLGFLPFLLISCSKNANPIESKFFGFDTYVDIKIYDGSKEDVSELENIFSTYDKLSDNYKERDVTNLYTINNTNENVVVDEKLYQMLQVSFEAKNKGATYFDPLCGSLAKKWKEAINNKQVLADDVISNELTKINNTTFSFLDSNTVKRDGEAELDLGGIAKGYALDQVKSYLDNKDIHQYLINGGSSSILLGEKNTKDGLFNVGLKDIPNAFLKVKNCFVSTSSISEQGVEIDGVKYSHIINPLTGSATSLNDGVIVISENGSLGDALSTSMMMNTIDEIKEIESNQGVKAIVIKDGAITYKNNGIEVYYH